MKELSQSIPGQQYYRISTSRRLSWRASGGLLKDTRISAPTVRKGAEEVGTLILHLIIRRVFLYAALRTGRASKVEFVTS